MEPQIEQRVFWQHSLKYIHEWIPIRHYDSRIAPFFGEKLLSYYDFVSSHYYPDSLFNRTDILRCSELKIKNLPIHMQKKISLQLIQKKFIQAITSKTPPSKIPTSISKLSQYAALWYEIGMNQQKNAGHELVLAKILKLNPAALSIEIPVWTNTVSHSPAKVLSSPFLCHANCLMTGHIDLLLFDENDGGLIVADYKPENRFLSSLPQIITYGLMMRQILKITQVKCVSFSREAVWIYDPQILFEVLLNYIKEFTMVDFPWQKIEMRNNP